MGIFTCGCLNVRIHIKNNDLKPIDISQIGIQDDNKDDFFNLEISENSLDLEGIKVEHGLLLKKHQVGDWLVHRCVNCDMHTHASHVAQGSNKLLLNTSLKGDPTIIERLQKSADFSPLYKIVLRSRNDNHPVRTLGLQSGKYDSLQETLTDIQTKLNKFLVKEEGVMEDRIRQYEDEQRSGYAELQSKARRDKNAMISLVLAAEEQEQRETGEEDMEESPLTQSFTQSLTQSARMDFSSMDKPQPQRVPQAFNPPRTIPVMNQNTAPKPKVIRVPAPRSDLDIDSDALFDLDGLNDDPTPYYESDEELDTDDSTNDEYVPRSRPLNPSINYSCSVPISVPMFDPQGGHTSASRNTDLYDFDEDRDNVPDPDSMAASIKAMAQSVHGDGSEVFGDRPRRRPTPINALNR